MSMALVQKLQDVKLLHPQAAERVREHLVEGKSIDQALLTAGGLSQEQYLQFLSEEFQVPYIDLEHNPPTKEFLKNFPGLYRRMNLIFPERFSFSTGSKKLRAGPLLKILLKCCPIK